MRLTEVRLDHFRNLESATLGIPTEGAILVGDNGQGKTNFLEAIHYLALFRSFRAARHSEAIAFDAEHFRVEGGVAYADGSARRVAVAADRRERRIAVDGRPAASPAEAAGAVLTVLLAPDDLELVGGPPSARRRFLDRLLALGSRRAWTVLQEYDRALRQRNELLRGRAPVAESVLAPWDETLVAAGVELVTARARLVARLAERFGGAAARIAGPGERAGFALRYRPSVPIADGADDPAEIGRAWRAALLARRDRDRAMGWTTVGPHRDELDVRLAGRSLARYGSQGERRTAAIALKLLEAEVLEADTGHRPILLLDDVFSELDGGRAGRLLAAIGARHQRFVTTPRPLPWLDGGLARWRVTAGRIDAEAADGRAA